MKLFLLVNCGIVLLLSGCSVFVPSHQTMCVTLRPPDSVLKVNGEVITTPAEFRVKRDHDAFLECSHEGFPSQHRTIETHINAAGFCDTVGLVLWLLPGIGLAAPGSHSLDTTDVDFDLTHPYVPPAPPAKVVPLTPRLQK